MEKKNKLLLFVLVSAILIVVTLFLDNTLMKIVPHLRISFLNPIFAFLGASLGAIIYMIFLSTLFLYEKKTKLVLYLAVAVISAFVVSYLLKLAIMRPRPEIIPLVIKSTSSFPSSHAAVASATFFFIRKLKSTYFLALIPTILVVLTGYYNGVHYLSDVLAGVFIGVTTSYFISQRFSKYTNP